MRGITTPATILVASSVGLAACGRTEQRGSREDRLAPSRQRVESVIAAQRPLLDSSRAEVARTRFREPTLLGFGFEPDSASGTASAAGWSPIERRALADLARELGARWVMSSARPAMVTDVTGNVVHDLTGSHPDVGVLLLRPGFPPVVLPRDGSLDRIRAAAREAFGDSAPVARRA
jgi:hypothetical protein